MEISFFDSQLFNYMILPGLIFIARVCDVSIGTMRIIFVAKGKKNIAPFLGFFEVLIWIIAVSRIMQNIDNYICYVAYAAGFATGNFVGMLIEEKLAVGTQLIRVITPREGKYLVKMLNSNGLGATLVEASGAKENVNIVYSIVHRNDIPEALRIINAFDPKVFFTVEDVRTTSEGIFPKRKISSQFSLINVLKRWRPGK